MVRCWELAPSSEQIVEDIRGFQQVLKKVVEANGTIVRNEGLRHGRRLLRHDIKGLLTTRLKISQRKENLCQAALDPKLQFLLDDLDTLSNDKLEAAYDEQIEDDHADDINDIVDCIVCDTVHDEDDVA
jgi:hypothetical protein